MDARQEFHSDESVDEAFVLQRAAVWLRANKTLRATVRTLLLGMFAFGPIR